jgi:hypothetical protein
MDPNKEDEALMALAIEFGKAGFFSANASLSFIIEQAKMMLDDAHIKVIKNDSPWGDNSCGGHWVWNPIKQCDTLRPCGEE